MTYFKTSMASADPADISDAIEQAHTMTLSIPRQYGLDRFQLGFILHTGIQKLKSHLGTGGLK